MSKCTEFEHALQMLADTFKKYSGTEADGKCDELEQSEMVNLIEKELKNYNKVLRWDANKIFEKLDQDESKSIEFKEFVALIADIVTEMGLHKSK